MWLGLLVCGCGSEVDRERCDPLEAMQPATELGDILAAGRAADGTLYVVEVAAGLQGPRVFVTEGDGIGRVMLAGIGEEMSPDRERWGYSVDAHEPPFSLTVSRSGDELRIGVLEGDGSKALIEIGEEGEELTLVDDAEVRALPAYDVELSFEYELAADTPDGRTLAIVGPQGQVSDPKRVFFGKHSLDEHERIGGSYDDGVSTMSFELDDGERAVVEVPAFPSPTDPATLTIRGKTKTLTIRPNDELQGRAFRCFAE